jgi:hypothetical protein
MVDWKFDGFEDWPAETWEYGGKSSRFSGMLEWLRRFEMAVTVEVGLDVQR